MRGPHLQKTSILSFTIVSIALHLSVFAIALIILKQSNQVSMPSPYTVSLVSPEVSPGIPAGNKEEVAREAPEKPSVPSVEPRKSKKDAVKEKRTIEDSINQLKRKKEKIDTLDRLRQITIKVSNDKRRHSPKGASPSAEKGNAYGKYPLNDNNYTSTIMDGIQPYWSLPPGMGKKGLEAIISVKILKDGTASVQKIEKSSGNVLFDRAAISALTKASPLPPPPQEMEISVRFYP